ncbi:MAG: lipase family protein [Bacteroidales bacterium]
MKKYFSSLGTLVALLYLFNFNIEAQSLKPGFSKTELSSALLINSRTGTDSSAFEGLPEPSGFDFVYRSPEIGLLNIWELWTAPENDKAIVSIRGTTPDIVSWLANFYAAMVPAQGTLILSEKDTFHYKLAENPRASIHVGWLTSTAYLSEDILPKIDSLYNKGMKNFIITGHSQGGAITYLLTAYLVNLQNDGKLPSDIQFKTYSTAAPKPGNLHFAYEYEKRAQEGWAFNVVNSIDWVPETPFSIQTLDDFNTINPFTNARETIIKKQKFPQRLVMRRIYNQLDKPSKKARKEYQKYLGKMISGQIQKSLPGYQPPEYFNSNHYVRTGNFIILHPESDYFEIYPEEADDIWRHHGFKAYFFLIEKI